MTVGMERDHLEPPMDGEDEVARLIRWYERDWPELRETVRAGAQRRARLRGLAQLRGEVGFTQEEVARRMQTTQSAVARLESGETDARLSTLELYALALGMRLEWEITDAPRGNVVPIDRAG